MEYNVIRWQKEINSRVRKMTDSERDLYINKCNTFINFMLRQQQWTGLSRHEIDGWISNFGSVTSEEKYLIYKLLTNIIYYSEDDIIDALKEGINDKIFYKKMIKMQIDSGFQISQHSISQAYKDELRNSCFIPLLDRGKPYESANYILRLCIQNRFITTNQSIFLDGLVSYTNDKKVENLVIIDDCVGSGDQLRAFWHISTVTENGKEISLREFCKTRNINVFYLTLFGFKDTISALNSEFDDLNVVCVRELTRTLNVFDDASYVWDDVNERNKALDLFQEFASNNNFDIHGYNYLDFAIIMHRTIPDWSLPIFWKENADWKPLMRRKDSHD